MRSVVVGLLLFVSIASAFANEGKDQGVGDNLPIFKIAHFGSGPNERLCGAYFTLSSEGSPDNKERLAFYVDLIIRVGHVHVLPSIVQVKIDNRKEVPTADVFPDGEMVVVLHISRTDYDEAAGWLPSPTPNGILIDGPPPGVGLFYSCVYAVGILYCQPWQKKLKLLCLAEGAFGAQKRYLKSCKV